jgi:hypothetical protein
MLNKIDWREDADLAMLFEQIVSMENKCNAVRSNILHCKDPITVILDSVPMDYKAGLTAAEQRARGNLPVLDDLETVLMNQHWWPIGKNNDSNNGNKITLVTTFSGVCILSVKARDTRQAKLPQEWQGREQRLSHSFPSVTIIHSWSHLHWYCLPTKLDWVCQ